MGQETDQQRDPLSRIERMRRRLRVAEESADPAIIAVLKGILDLLEDDYRLEKEEGGK